MHFEAVFQPVDETSYNADAVNFVGKKIAIQAGWIIDEGPHKGQQCFYVPNSTMGTIPQSDLRELKDIPYVQWKDLHNHLGLAN